MTSKRKIEVFSAGCPVCEDLVQRVKAMACPSCEIEVVDTKDAAAAGRMRALGIRSVPAVAVDGKLADCCSGRGPDEAVLRAAGLGQPLASN
ncbi:MAG: thioredoxin family protein [Rhodospirillales bacterium]|nr:thioredoxin family protein [Rhodospirillales bacterium]